MRGGGEEEEEEWVEASMADDAVVAELLVRIKQSSAVVKISAAAELAWPPLLEWGARQPRSRCGGGGGGGGVVVGHQSKESTRASPTTPLSWSAGTSGSGDGGAAGDWFEESRPSERSNKIFFFLRFWYHCIFC
ncbi:hypothetical protein Sjap_011000 [Stephania japonica]|uniref:Uncharacterized protein n=1 Tax=Stephania japonica TaxID=461633 RepID=A0AAP0JAM8_9MAGN